MLYNYETIIIGYEQCILVPYRHEHVERYHHWMCSEQLLELTESEPLSIEEEYDMQKEWKYDNNKITFIILSKDRVIEIISSYIDTNNNNSNDSTEKGQEHQQEQKQKQHPPPISSSSSSSLNHHDTVIKNDDEMEFYIRLFQILLSPIIRKEVQQQQQQQDDNDGDQILNREMFDVHGMMTGSIEKLLNHSLKTTPSSSSPTDPPIPSSSLFVGSIPSSFISMTLSAMIGDVNLFISDYDDDEDDEHEEEVAVDDRRNTEHNNNEIEHRKQGEIDIMIAELDYRGRGIGIEVISCFMDYISQHCCCYYNNTYRYYCKINETNISSISLFYNKLLFTLKNYTECFHEYEYEYKYETIYILRNEIRKRLFLHIIQSVSSSLSYKHQHDTRFDTTKKRNDNPPINDCNKNIDIVIPNEISTDDDVTTEMTNDDTYNITIIYPTLLPMLYCPSTD